MAKSFKTLVSSLYISKIFIYCCNLVDVTSLGWTQSDHIKQHLCTVLKKTIMKQVKTTHLNILKLQLRVMLRINLGHLTIKKLL
jgi:hypothetical protein